jgi:hypothetical protein
VNNEPVNYAIYGHPNLTNDPAFLGHMINDGAKGHSTTDLHNQKDKVLYDKVSHILGNAEFYPVVGLCCVILATKEIHIGEEVLVSYGYSYWETVNDQH